MYYHSLLLTVQSKTKGNIVVSQIGPAACTFLVQFGRQYFEQTLILMIIHSEDKPPLHRLVEILINFKNLTLSNKKFKKELFSTNHT